MTQPLSTRQDFITTVTRLRSALAGPLPGAEAQMRMAPDPRPDGERSDDPAHHPRPGAVLLLLFPQQDHPYLLLTRRSDDLPHHRGQISFPGGQVDPSDASPAEAALREAEEEVGVSPSQVAMLGTLTPCYIPPSNFLVHPFVGFTRSTPVWKPDPIEVAAIIEVPLAGLLADDCVRSERWQLREREALVPFFHLNGHKVWGATAMILAEFVALLCSAEAADVQRLSEKCW